MFPEIHFYSVSLAPTIPPIFYFFMVSSFHRFYRKWEKELWYFANILSSERPFCLLHVKKFFQWKNSQIYRYFIKVQIFLVMQTYTFSCQSFLVAVSRTTLQKVLPSEIELNRCVCECMAAVLPGYIWPIKYLLFLSPFQAALWPPASFCGENKISISQSAFIKWCTMIVNAKMQFTQVS